MARAAPSLARAEMLKWAREACRMQLSAAADRAKVEVDELTAWESGTGAPSIPQLRRLGETYRRPLTVFFLPRPPEDLPVSADFRRGGHGDMTPELYQEVRQAHARRAIALELAEALDEPPPRFTALATLEEDPEEVGQRLRLELAVTLEAQTEGDNSGDHRNLRLWRGALESRGVLVFQMLGLPETTIRGFSIAGEHYPVIVVNPKDALNGRVFTLLHEFVHLTLRQAGMCGQGGTHIETFCDHVAGAILMPAPAVRAMVRGGKEWDIAAVQRGARHFGVSEFAFATRLRQLECLSREEYVAHASRLHGRVSKPKGGGEWYRNHAARLGRQFIFLVLHAYERAVITQRDVGNYLDMKISNVDKLVERVQ